MDFRLLSHLLSGKKSLLGKIAMDPADSSLILPSLHLGQNSFTFVTSHLYLWFVKIGLLPGHNKANKQLD